MYVDGIDKTRYLLRPAKVALMLDCSLRQVYELVKDGPLEGHNKTPGQRGLRIVAASIFTYIDKHRIPEEYWRQ